VWVCGWGGRASHESAQNVREVAHDDMLQTHSIVRHIHIHDAFMLVTLVHEGRRVHGQSRHEPAMRRGRHMFIIGCLGQKASIPQTWQRMPRIIRSLADNWVRHYASATVGISSAVQPFVRATKKCTRRLYRRRVAMNGTLRQRSSRRTGRS